MQGSDGGEDEAKPWRDRHGKCGVCVIGGMFEFHHKDGEGAGGSPKRVPAYHEEHESEVALVHGCHWSGGLHCSHFRLNYTFLESLLEAILVLQ